mmetsp:Transcript_12650/g.36385  ORF Transcript_12650/g.36385 Transcript_12650/m.36385 type:complete len:235 (-) Transcript_12650:392-1096(-)
MVVCFGTSSASARNSDQDTMPSRSASKASSVRCTALLLRPLAARWRAVVMPVNSRRALFARGRSWALPATSPCANSAGTAPSLPLSGACLDPTKMSPPSAWTFHKPCDHHVIAQIPNARASGPCKMPSSFTSAASRTCGNQAPTFMESHEYRGSSFRRSPFAKTSSIGEARKLISPSCTMKPTAVSMTSRSMWRSNNDIAVAMRIADMSSMARNKDSTSSISSDAKRWSPSPSA